MGRVHEYCCCAIPLLNVGIYTTLVEQFTIGLLAGTLTIATPKIVGASVPSFAPWLFAILCYVVAGMQSLGFIGVFKEKSILFERYVSLNAMVVISTFAVGAAFIGVSASKHNTAITSCESTFFGANTQSDAEEGQILCEVFTWVDIGLMIGLWVVLAIFQGYLILVTRFYGSSQRADHKKYYSIYSASGGLDGDILLNDRAPHDDTWNPRASTESWAGDARNPGRDEYAAGGSGLGSRGSPYSSSPPDSNPPIAVEPSYGGQYHTKSRSGTRDETFQPPTNYSAYPVSQPPHDPYESTAPPPAAFDQDFFKRR